MVLLFLSSLLVLLRSATALSPQVVLGGFSEDPYAASDAHARKNANSVFNAIHSATRQWGSSILHNGVTFFPATVPEGTLLYRGDDNSHEPETYEWLAFEIPHAEMFAHSRGLARMASGQNSSLDQSMLEVLIAREDNLSGYLHTYRANRPLKLLYIDGMSAAKCDKGSLDLQDILVNHTAGLELWDEDARAEGLCAFGAQFGIEGFIRMETGFEIIKCNFKTGLDIVSVRKRPALYRQPEGVHSWSFLEYIREASQWYVGNMGGRVILDYSNMVSAFFYPANMTNSDMGPKFPRLSSATPEQRLRIRTNLASVLKNTDQRENIHWQNVVDMIVARYSDRLQFMATDPPHPEFLGLANSLLNLYIDFRQPTVKEEVIAACAKHYLIPITPVTETDHLIYTSILTVTHEICSKLFAARSVLLDFEGKNPTPPDETYDDQSIPTPISIIHTLNAYLDWTNWRFCPQTCSPNEICFTPTFPFGSREDHENPGCRNNTAIMAASKWEFNYWVSE